MMNVYHIHFVGDGLEVSHITDFDSTVLFHFVRPSSAEPPPNVQLPDGTVLHNITRSSKADGEWISYTLYG